MTILTVALLCAKTDPASSARPAARMVGSFLNDSGRADISGTARILEASNRFGDDLLGQPQDDFRKIDGESDGGKEDNINWQRRSQRLRESNADEFGRHQQNQAIRRRNEAERQRRDEHDT